MKIGVLTHSGTDDNYGQILQAFALQKYLVGKGYDVFLIKYSSDNDKSTERFVLLKNLIRFVLRIISKKRRDMHHYIKHMQSISKDNRVKNVRRKFKEFLSENMRLTRVYSSYQDLLSDPPKADVYIVGSDQVWNPSLNNPTTAAWYLQFGDSNIKRISYAASIGRSIKPEEEKSFTSYLSTLDAISLRENNAFEYCKSIGVDCHLVVDPTLLASFSVYNRFITKDSVSSKPYLFLYYLNVETKEELAWYQLDSFIKCEDLELKTVSSSGYYPAQSLIPGNENDLLTIPEWLTSIYHSKYVVTTSFHGTVFALLMHKPFVAIPLTNRYSSGNGRLTSLLKDLGLEGRMLTPDKRLDSILKTSIDWKDIDYRLANMRAASELFLLNALNDH